MTCIKNTIIQKLYYNKYPYKVSVKISKRPTLYDFYQTVSYDRITSNINNEVESYFKKIRNLLINEHDLLLSDFIANLPQDKNTWRMEKYWYDGKINIFFEMKKDLDNFIKIYKHRITEIFSVEDDNSLKVFNESENIVIRDTLYHRKYRFKISVASPNIQEYSNIIDTFKENMENEDDIEYTTSHYTSYVYLKNNTDLALFKIINSDIIRNVYRIVLKSEVPVSA